MSETSQSRTRSRTIWPRIIGCLALVGAKWRPAASLAADACRAVSGALTTVCRIECREQAGCSRSISAVLRPLPAAPVIRPIDRGMTAALQIPALQRNWLSGPLRPPTTCGSTAAPKGRESAVSTRCSRSPDLFEQRLCSGSRLSASAAGLAVSGPSRSSKLGAGDELRCTCDLVPVYRTVLQLAHACMPTSSSVHRRRQSWPMSIEGCLPVEPPRPHWLSSLPAGRLLQSSRPS